MNRERAFRPKIATAIRYLTKQIAVFLIPAVRALPNFYLEGNLDKTAATALAVSVFWLAFAAAEVIALKIRIFDGVLEVRRGLIFRRVLRLPLDKIASVSVDRGPVWALTGAVRVRAETEAGPRRRADFECYLAEPDAAALRKRIYGDLECEFRRRASAGRILLFCALTSSAAAGFLTAAPLVNLAGKVLGREIGERIYGTVDQTAAFVAALLPVAGGYLAGLLLTGYVLAFGFLFLRYANLTVRASADVLRVRSGLGGARETTFRRRDVCAVVAEQGALLRPAGRYSVRVCVAGYGKKRTESAVILPAQPAGTLTRAVRELLPERNFETRELRTAGRAERSFFRLPAATAAAAAVVLIAAAVRGPALWVPLSAAALIWSAAALGARRICLRQGGIGFEKGLYAVFRRGNKVFRAEIPEGRSGPLTVRSGAADRLGLCSVFVRVRSERAARMAVHGLDRAATIRRLEERFGIEIGEF